MHVLMPIMNSVSFLAVNLVTKLGQNLTCRGQVSLNAAPRRHRRKNSDAAAAEVSAAARRRRRLPWGGAPPPHVTDRLRPLLC
jgi:hypothetical protein